LIHESEPPSTIPDPEAKSEEGIDSAQTTTVIRLASFFCVPVAFFTTFVGLVEFFYLSILILLTGLVVLLTYTVANWSDLPIQLLWVFYLLPLMELFLSLCFDILRAFFGEIWDIVNLDSVRRYLSRQIDDFSLSTSLIFKVFIGVKLLWLAVCFLFLIVFLIWSLITHIQSISGQAFPMG
jgi:hypothetical protein